MRSFLSHISLRLWQVWPENHPPKRQNKNLRNARRLKSQISFRLWQVQPQSVKIDVISPVHRGCLLISAQQPSAGFEGQWPEGRLQTRMLSCCDLFLVVLERKPSCTLFVHFVEGSSCLMNVISSAVFIALELQRGKAHGNAECCTVELAQQACGYGGHYEGVLLGENGQWVRNLFPPTALDSRWANWTQNTGLAQGKESFLFQHVVIAQRTKWLCCQVWMIQGFTVPCLLLLFQISRIKFWFSPLSHYCNVCSFSAVFLRVLEMHECRIPLGKQDTTIIRFTGEGWNDHRLHWDCTLHEQFLVVLFCEKLCVLNVRSTLQWAITSQQRGKFIQEICLPCGFTSNDELVKIVSLV